MRSIGYGEVQLRTQYHIAIVVRQTIGCPLVKTN
jgi:hypothetical protein